ncbi:hypothetical protein [Actinomadura madurae]|uniref:hypothetical protein n=1 Tax=Actinomadura madurae TaxID=1993 RepID=UPI0020D1FD48|nr:hypothetical protein [Actinomadura madurae]MCP9948996.1 hypothetical protein [Actinomadura madurae]MCP9965767.1 hypothetical protein [Actinomadura madurae]MCP9978243.1 hypothetical protein [Actinomadura madurae]MCQ0014448.1 hypothetical protein [Actinomadura madurae]
MHEPAGGHVPERPADADEPGSRTAFRAQGQRPVYVIRATGDRGLLAARWTAATA